VLLTPLFSCCLGLPVLRRQSLPLDWLVVWALVFPGFYLFYSYTHYDWWWLRFLLPAFPPLTVGGPAGGADVARPPRDLLPRLVAGSGRTRGARSLARSGRATCTPSAPVAAERVYPEMAVWLQDHLAAYLSAPRCRPAARCFIIRTSRSSVGIRFLPPISNGSPQPAQPPSGPSTRPSSPSKSRCAMGGIPKTSARPLDTDRCRASCELLALRFPGRRALNPLPAPPVVFAMSSRFSLVVLVQEILRRSPPAALFGCLGWWVQQPSPSCSASTCASIRRLTGSPR